MPTLSIALTTYNGQKYLAAQLKSLVDQSARVSELVVADDGSTDHSLAMLREFSPRAPFPVRIIENATRLGYRTNFMQAAAACSGELIAFCDQDDVWHRDKLASVSQAFDDPEVLLAFHNARLVDDAGGPLGKLFRSRQRRIFPPLSTRPWMIVPGLVQVFRKSLTRFTPLHAQSADPYAPGEKMSHDLWYPFWASVLGKIAYLPDTLVEYRQHGANTSGWPYPRLADFARENIANAEDYAEANAVSSRNRLELLAKARDTAAPDDQVKIDAAIDFYRALHAFSESRAGLYRDPVFANRARTMFQLLRQGAYTRRDACSLGLDALLLDAAVGLPSARLGRKTV